MKDKEKNFASAVIYVHNAGKRIADYLKTVIQVMEENFEHSEIICVNDFSSDDSLEVIRKTSRDTISTSVSVINMSSFHGLELAMNAGLDLSIGDFVFEFDNTFLDFDTTMIMEVYRRSLEGYDIVSASPDRRERLTSGVFYKIFDHYTDLTYKMSTESFRVLSRRAINRICSMNKTILYRKAIYANCGLLIDNIRYKTTSDNISDFDKKEKGYRSNLAVDSLILFTEMGYSFSKAMTVVMMVVSLFMMAYSVVIYATSTPVVGWTTTILFFSVAFFGLFGILTIIIKYLQLLVDLEFKRKRYSFTGIEKLTK